LKRYERYDLNRCVEVFKQSSGKYKDDAYMAIQEHLTHHINSLCNIIIGTNYSVNPKVHKMIVAGLYASTKSTSIEHLRTIAKNYDEEDFRQEIDIEIIRLINSYRYNKAPFIEFVTFLLPRRISSVLWKQSKDMLNQFSIDKLDIDFSSANSDGDTGNARIDTIPSRDNIETEEINSLIFLTQTEYDMLSDYIVDNFSIEEIARQYMMTEYNCENKLNELVVRVKNVLKTEQ
jgi:hypothetical protein